MISNAAFPMPVTRRRFVSGLLLAPLAGPVGAQESYPSRPVTLIVPFSS